MNAKATKKTTDEANAAATGAAPAVVPAAAPTQKLTRAEKLVKRLELLKNRIEADTAEYQEIANELNSAAALSSLVVGSKVQVKMGRKFADKDTTRFVDSTIVGIRNEEDGGTQYKITFGSGFDADIAVVAAGAITKVYGTEGEAAAS